jgi:hypothetical protein
VIVSVSLPRRPIPDHLLADLHANNLPADIEQDLWSQVAADPDARRLLDALDGVTAVLRHLDDEPTAPPAPADIVARLDCALAESSGDELAAKRRSDGPASRTPVVRDGRRQSSRRRVAVLSAAAAVVAVATVAGVTLATGALSTGAGSDSGPVVAAPPAGTTIDSLSKDAILAALGRDSVAGRLADRAVLSRCLGGASETGPVLGTLGVDYQGQSGVLVLVGGGRPGAITALILSTACDAENPRVLARTELR